MSTIIDFLQGEEAAEGSRHDAPIATTGRTQVAGPMEGLESCRTDPPTVNESRLNHARETPLGVVISVMSTECADSARIERSTGRIRRVTASTRTLRTVEEPSSTGSPIILRPVPVRAAEIEGGGRVPPARSSGLPSGCMRTLREPRGSWSVAPTGPRCDARPGRARLLRLNYFLPK